MRFNMVVTAVETGGSIGLFHLARRVGASDVVSYLVGSIAPVVGGCMVWAMGRDRAGHRLLVRDRPLLQHERRGAHWRRERGPGAAFASMEIDPGVVKFTPSLITP
jgi:hypothetical protein